MENKSVSFILCYARSGGTFLNKFLNNFDDLVVLSEAHPIHNKKGGIHSVKEQMKQWHGVEIKADDYIEQMIEAKKWCDENDKHLVIRDWSYIDFAKSHLNQYTPIKKSTNLGVLETHFNVNKIAYVRDGIDIFLSQGKHITKFSEEYLAFVKYITKLNVKTFKYEDFCSDFITTSDEILNILGVTNYKRSFSFSSDKVIGDIKGVSRGNQYSSVLLLDRRFAFRPLIKKIDSDKNLIEANKILNYESFYASRKRESFKVFFSFKINQTVGFIRKVISKIKKKNE